MPGFCNAPIIVSVNGYTQVTGMYFPCVSLVLDDDFKNELTAECGSGKYIRFDLSAYAKGLLYNSTISPSSAIPQRTVSYKIYRKDFGVTSTDDYNQQGDGGSVTVYLGRGDVLARYKGSESTAVTYKPTSTEVVNEGDYYVSRGQETAATGTVVSSTSTGVYVENNPLRHQLIFLNSFGRWESASALTRESKQYKYSTNETDVDASFPDNVDRPHRITSRQLNEVVWSMSSGYVTMEWAEWWAKEVLAAEFVWLKEGSRLIPVVLEPNDSTTVFNKAKGNLCHIDFKVKFI